VSAGESATPKGFGERLGGKWREFSVGEQVCAYCIGGGTVLLLTSLFGPWFKLDLGRYGVSGLSGGDAKGSVGLALLVIALCVLLRLATPLRAVWIYPALAVIGIFAFVKAVDAVGTGTSGSSNTIKETAFARAAVFGSLVIVLAAIAATIVCLRRSGGRNEFQAASAAPPVGSVLPASPLVPRSDSLANELERLGELRRSNFLSEEEFAEAKAQVLASGSKEAGAAPTRTTEAAAPVPAPAKPPYWPPPPGWKPGSVDEAN
jgi:hypothetical protein